MHKLIALAAVAAASLLPVSASAADLGGGGMKDGGFTAEPPRDLGGFGIRVFLGYSFGDRDVSQRNSGEVGLRHTPDCSHENPEKQAKCEGWVDEFKTGLVEHLNENGVDASWNGTTFELPLIRALSDIVANDDVRSLSGGAELEYLFHHSGLVFGIVGGVQLYADADTTTAYEGAPVRLGGGALLSPHGSEADGFEVPGLTTSGYVGVERNLDIDLALKAGAMVSENTLLYALAGPSFAKATVKGGVGIDGTDLAMEYEDDQWSIGYVVGVGVQHFFGDGWSANGQLDFRQHEFDAGKSIEGAIPLGGSSEIYGKASSKSDVEDSIWTVKAGVARHW